MSRRLTPRGEQRRSELLAFATKRFAANGYHPTSVAELVDGLGVGKGVFYWYAPCVESHQGIRHAAC
jgi:AcrR family transcriptional regulator